MSEQPSIARTNLAAALGGAWGGALVGLVEASLITATSGPAEEYWLFPYAVASYGLCGAAIGVGSCIVMLLGTRAAGRTMHLGFGPAIGLTLFLLGTVVARYHIVQRVFHEELVTLSATGLAVHVGVIAMVGALALLIAYAGDILHRRPRGLLSGMAGLILCIGVTSVAAVIASARAGEPAITRTTEPAAHGRPNIILILIDTLRADAVGAYGAGPQASPVLDQFASTAVRFENAYSQATWTRPSIATVLTSLYPSVHGAVHKMDALPEGVTTLAEALRARGYWTAGFVSNINVAPVFNFQQGFQEYTYLAPDFYFGATDSATRLAIYKGLREARERFFRNRIYFYNYYQDAAVVNGAVVKWLEQHPPSPFFVFIHYMDPHDPYFEIPYSGIGVARVTNPNPAPQRQGELRKLYAEDVAYLDQHLTDLFSRLRTLGLYDDSIIAVTADHGEEFQDHGGWWHGTTLYQEQMHVPLIVKRAHEPQPGTAEARAVRSLDIAPTLMSAASLTPPGTFAGRDLFGVGTDSEPLFAEEDLEGNVLASLRIGPWKIITANPNNPRGLKPVELYNLSDDATEHHDLAASEPARAKEMLRLLAEERARIARPTRLGTVSPIHAADHRS